MRPNQTQRNDCSKKRTSNHKETCLGIFVRNVVNGSNRFCEKKLFRAFFLHLKIDLSARAFIFYEARGKPTFFTPRPKIFLMSQTNNAFNPADLLTTFNGTSIAPVDGFDPNRPDVFIELFHSISSFLAMIGNPLAETHRGNSTFYHSILDHVRGFETSLSLYCCVMEAEAPLYQERQNQVRAHRIGDIQRERRKRTYQQMEEKQSKRDELLKKLKTWCSVMPPL